MKPNPSGPRAVEWRSLSANARTYLTNTDLDWVMEGAGLFTKQQRIDRSIETAFGNPVWWPEWREWRNTWKETPALIMEKSPVRGTPAASRLPYPPDEPEGVWEEAAHLLKTGTYLESISAALIRLLLAQGRAARHALDRAA